MQEFSSVTASSYDAESLAPLLSEKSAQGWDIVSIVAAGTNIVAYLSREASGEAVSEAPANAYVPAVAEPVAEPVLAETAAPYVPVQAAITTEVVPEVVAAVAEPVIAAVDEPAGWAKAPDNDIADLVAQVAAADGGAGDGMVEAATEQVANVAAGAADTIVAEPAAEPTAAEAVVAEPAAEPAAESTVPAGWYADPSGRYELRYWDGNAWTEHVSRAGQQFTDPPVA